MSVYGLSGPDDPRTVILVLTIRDVLIHRIAGVVLPEYRQVFDKVRVSECARRATQHIARVQTVGPPCHSLDLTLGARIVGSAFAVLLITLASSPPIPDSACAVLFDRLARGLSRPDDNRASTHRHRGLIGSRYIRPDLLRCHTRTR